MIFRKPERCTEILYVSKFILMRKTLEVDFVMKTSDEKSHGVVTGRDVMVYNSGGVTILCKCFEMLGLPVVQSLLGFINIEGNTLPPTSCLEYQMILF